MAGEFNQQVYLKNSNPKSEVLINTALCSFGMSGWVFHAPFIHAHPEYNLYAVLERTKNLSKQKYPSVIIYRSLETLLADKNIDLVIINTPNYTHFEYTKEALNAGKHVVVEKPFTVTSAQAKELIALAKKANLKLTVYHNRRYDSDFKTIRKILKDEVLGEIVEAEIHYDRYRSELSPKVHKEIGGPGTGALYDLGAHLIDQALQLFGFPESVFADIRILREGSKVDDYFELVLYYPFLRVRLHCTYFAREAVPGYQIHGRKGSFIKQRTDVQEAMLQAGTDPSAPGWGKEPEAEKGLLHTEIDGKVIKEYVDSLTGNYGEFYDELYNSIRFNKPVPVQPEDALNVVRLIEAAFESDKQKTVIKLK